MVNGVNSTSLADLQSQMKALQEAKASAEKAKAEAAESNEKANLDNTVASEENQLAKTLLETAASATEAATTLHENAVQEWENANKASLNAYNLLNNLQNAAEPDQDAINAARENYQQLLIVEEQAKAAVQEAEKAKETAKEKETEAKKAVEEAEKNAEKAIEILKSAIESLEEAVTTLETTAEELDKIAEEYETAVAEAELEEIDETEAKFVPMTEEEAVKAGYTVIHNSDELIQKLNENPNGKFILMGHVDLDGINWTPIGDAKSPFKGEFNGNGYSIQNLNISIDGEAENIGFFGVTENATIQNVDFFDAKVSGSTDWLEGASSVGIVAGTARGTQFSNITVTGDVSGFDSVGGLVGTINDNNYYDEFGLVVEINNSSLTDIDADVNTDAKYYAGGLVGYVKSTASAEGVARKDLMIRNCHTSGTGRVEEESAGGLIGEAGKTIITLDKCTSDMDLTWDNEEWDGDFSFLMETGRIGGMIGCVNGSYIAICNCEYTGDINATGEFQGDNYGWYMNDAQITLFELSGGLPVDDILNISGVDGMHAITQPDGSVRYEVTVSTLTGLDKMVTMIQAKPELADVVTFNVNFDFKAMDAMYDPSVYAQYGIVQHLYEDENGVVHNDVYIDNEIDMETTFHSGESLATSPCEGNLEIKLPMVEPTMVKGLYKDMGGNYVVNTREGLKTVNIQQNCEGQITNVTKRLTQSEVRYREYITEMVKFYQNQMYDSLRKVFGLDENTEIPVITKAEYKKLLKKAEKAGGLDKLSKKEQLAIAVYQVDYNVMNAVSNTTKNFGCGMGGNASFLSKTTTYQMFAKDGRALYTNLNGDQLVQQIDKDGNPILDDEGNIIYEFADGSGTYEGLLEIFEQRGYQTTDENGNLLFTMKDADGNETTVTQTKDADGNITYSYTNADGEVVPFEGNEEDLTRQLTPFENGREYKDLEQTMKDLISAVGNGEFPNDGTTPLIKAEAPANKPEQKEEVPANEAVTAEETNAASEDISVEDDDEKKKEDEV